MAQHPHPSHRRPPVSQGGRVDLDEAGAVDEDFGPHVAHGDQLGPVLQPGVVLLQDLKEKTGQAVSQRPGRTEGAAWGLRRRVWGRQPPWTPTQALSPSSSVFFNRHAGSPRLTAIHLVTIQQS